MLRSVYKTMLLCLLLLSIYCVPIVSSESRATSRIFMTRDDNSICKISLFNASECEEVVGKLPLPFGQITSLTRSDLNSKLYFVANGTSRNASTIFASYKNKHWCLYQGHGLKHVAYDWGTDNLFIAANGLGIGVCTSRADLHKKCSHITAAHRHQLLRGYGSLLVYPQRGVIYWVDYNSDYPQGVVMKAGMDGKNISPLTDKNGLVKIRLSDFTIANISVDSTMLSSSIISVDGSVYSMSRKIKTLVELTGTGKDINMPEVDGKCVLLAYSTGFQDVRYQGFSDPCLSANCSHSCVLKEVSSISSMPSSACIIRDDQLIHDAMKPVKESLKIVWIQIGCLLPTVIIVYITCFFLIYEIVSSYLDYLRIVDQ
uniref:Uncharacterized protein n=1 Tax=Ditylenchus dipsaci TaxID=166011 RepID=A0A915DRR4_9BILA